MTEKTISRPEPRGALAGLIAEIEAMDWYLWEDECPQARTSLRSALASLREAAAAFSPDNAVAQATRDRLRHQALLDMLGVLANGRTSAGAVTTKPAEVLLRILAAAEPGEEELFFLAPANDYVADGEWFRRNGNP